MFPAVVLLAAFLTLLGCDDGFSRGCNGQSESGDRVFYPVNGASHVNPDVHLKITFPTAPPLGNTGTIRVYDVTNDRQPVDELDLSIAPGPRNTRTPAPYDTLTYEGIPDTVYTPNEPDTDKSHVYQENFIGDEPYHFFPVLINGNEATICLHNYKLEYNKTYYVEIDPEVFPFEDGSFAGIQGKTGWKFSTKNAPPSADATRLVVAADGTGDFDTVRAAIDFIPGEKSGTVNEIDRTIFIKNGVYEEIVFFHNKRKLTIIGEDRQGVVIRYANNGVFNPYHRSIFALDGASEVNLINLSLVSVGEAAAQAEGLYFKGEHLQVRHVTIIGSGDALQSNGTVYLLDTSILGFGDNILTHGALFFEDCVLGTSYGPHVWPRNTNKNHGVVFLNSRFYTAYDLTPEGFNTGELPTFFARSPVNGGYTYPYAEVVLLNCTLEGIPDIGWGDVCPDTSNIHFWEYNSVDDSGNPIDVSQRASYSRQLTMEKDAEIIADYSDPEFVLGGWTPELPDAVKDELSD